MDQSPFREADSRPADGLLPCSQQLTTGPYPEPDDSIPKPVSLRSALILYSRLRLGLPMGRNILPGKRSDN
jgi:hypothetical protein